jgi:hypothetical protein
MAKAKRSKPAKSSRAKSAKAAPSKARTSAPSKSKWVLPPAGQIQLHFARGRGATLSAAAKETLIRLSRELASGDTLGRRPDCDLFCEPDLAICRPQSGCTEVVIDCPAKCRGLA